MFIPKRAVLFIISSLAHAADIASFNTVQQPDIDYDSFHDKLSILGDFDSISFYEYEGQSNTTTSGNSLYLINSQSQFKSLYEYNGSITHFQQLPSDSILIIGDFQIENYSSPVIYNATEDEFIEIEGWSDHVDGTIMTTFYDEDDDLIYFGGDLSFDDEVYGLVIYSLSDKEIVDSPFRGFNEDSTVNTILKIADDDDEGSIIFGGRFNNLGDENLLVHKYSSSNVTYTNSSSNSSNTSVSVDPENVVSLKYATISSVNTDSSTSDDASLIICPDNEANWLLNSQNVGSWTASLPFEVYPTKLRLYNSLQSGTGVEYFRIITSPTNGIMNLTYIDPETEDFDYCDAWCPLLNVTYLGSIVDELGTSFYSVNSTLTTGTIGFGSKYQEFEFINSVSVSSVTVQVMSSYGNQAGLSGFQLYQSGIVTYANDTLNEPNCGDEDSSASVDLNGGASWSTFTDQDGSHLTTEVSASELDSQSVGVTFYPNVTYSGNYSVLLYTPGCNYDNTCSSRGIVNVTLTNGNGDYLTSELIYQNNEEEKYDTIYTGHLEVDDSVPYVDMTLHSAVDADINKIVFVADRVQLNLLSVDEIYYSNDTNTTTTKHSTEELYIPINGLFEYSLANFSNFDDSISNVSTNGSTNVYVGNSTINLVGSEIFSDDAIINGLAIINNTLYIGGEFESVYGDNLIALSLGGYNETSNSTEVTDENVIDGGVNGAITSIFLYANDSLILVGDFDQTDNSTTIDQLNSSATDSSITDLALYNGSWYSFASGSNFSITTFTNLTFNGIEYFIFNGDNSTVEIWDNTNSVWDTDAQLNLSQAIALSNFTIAAGQMSSWGLSDSDGGAYVSDPHLSSLPFELSGDSYEYDTALFLNDSMSVLGGQFNTTDEIQNLIIIDSDNDNTTFGIDGVTWDSDSKVISLLAVEDTLFIGLQNGGAVGNKDVAGLIIYDLSNATLAVQPAALSNSEGDVSVYSLVSSSSSLFVGGSFTEAGSLTCKSICSYNLDEARWFNPLSSGSLSGTVYKMAYYSAEKILVSGNLTIGGNTSTFAIVDTDANSIEIDSDLNNGIGYTIKNFILVDDDSVTGRIIAMGDQYLGYYNGSAWTSITDDLDMDKTTFKSIQLVDLNDKNSDNNEDIFDSDQILMVSGLIYHDTYGNFSTGFYNGTSWIPYLYTDSGSSTNTILQDKSITASSSDYSLTESVMKARNVVGVAFACALGSLLLAVLSYCLYYFLVGKNNVYGRPLEARVAEKEMLETVPPNQLINSLDHAKYLAE